LQQSNSQFIDEIYKPPVQKENKTILSEYVVKDMLAQGLDPLNKDDIQFYWMRKGISE
jgi:hypothetical protein